MHLNPVRVVAVLSALVLSSCAGQIHRSPADQLFAEGSYSVAVSAYEAEEAEKPTDSIIKRKLGVALLRAGDPDAATAKLSEAYDLGGDALSTLFFLAQAQEAAGDIDAALRSYERYIDDGGNPKAVRRKMALLGQLRIRSVLRAAIAAEDSLRAVAPPENALAVLNFANLGKDEELAALSMGLAAVMITDLRKVEELRILERTRIDLLVAELNLQTASPTSPGGSPPSDDTPETSADPSTEPSSTPQRAGRMLSARRLVQCAFQPLGSTRIQLSSNLIDVVTGEDLVTGDPVDGPRREVLYLEKALVFQVLTGLGIEPTALERATIAELPTENFDAFMSYCRGLYYSDLQMFDEAEAAFSEAAAEDPEFVEATDAAESLDGSPDEFDQASDDLWGPEDDLTGSDDSLLDDVVGNIGVGPDPDPGADESDGSDLTDSGGDADDVTIVDGEKPARLPSFPLPPGGAIR